MRKEYIWGILFFSGLWGISEAVLGDALYRADVPYASAALTVIGFVILTFARIYFPQKGTATLIAACAMLYKFLNTPFFACHLLGILLMGVCYDVAFGMFKIRNRSLCAAVAAYLSYILFALVITCVFRYEHWVTAGFSKMLRHIGIGGSIAALGSAVFVPLSFRLGERLKEKVQMPFRLQLRLVSSGVPLVTTGLWAFGIAAYLFS